MRTCRDTTSVACGNVAAGESLTTYRMLTQSAQSLRSSSENAISDTSHVARATRHGRHQRESALDSQKVEGMWLLSKEDRLSIGPRLQRYKLLKSVTTAGRPLISLRWPVKAIHILRSYVPGLTYREGKSLSIISQPLR